jgi:HTH-type transcriptional regulator, sugar sensing transcriptional regulator
MSTIRQETVATLQELGFTELEGEVYLFLLESPPATGYRIAKGVGRTNANTYKALDSLEAKGAVLVAEAEPRLCRAVPPVELLAQMRHRFESSRERAEALLERVERVADDQRIYNLATRAQVMERARRMVEEARHIVTVDLYPRLAEPLGPVLVAAAQRGVRVLAKVYAPTPLPGVEVVERQRGEEITEGLPWDGLSLNVDGREHLLASLHPGGEPQQAVWTASPFLSFKLYYSLIYELILTDLQQRIRGGAESGALQARVDHYADLHPISSRNAVLQGYIERMERELKTESRRDDE